MNKPLELKVYPPPNEPDPDCENCDGRGCMGCVFREYDHDCRNDCPMCCDRNVPANKRLTEAELVAEMYSAEIEYRQLLRDGYQPRSAYNEASTFHRFATSPDYLEAEEIGYRELAAHPEYRQMSESRSEGWRSAADYKRWVDEMVNRPESLRKAREHAPGVTVKRNRPKDES